MKWIERGDAEDAERTENVEEGPRRNRKRQQDNK